MNIKHFTPLLLCLFLSSSIIFQSCQNAFKIESKTLQLHEKVEIWANNYFDNPQEILPRELADFAQITFGTIYEFRKIETKYSLDTLDLILDTPFKSTLEDAVSFTLNLHEIFQDQSIFNTEETLGLIIIPRNINGSMYTRVLFLKEDSNKIELRNENCAYAEDYNWKNSENKCQNTESYNALMNGFNKLNCYWRLTNPSGCVPNSTINYRMAPSSADQEFNIECTSFAECLEMASTTFNPQICFAGSTPSYCSILETGNMSEPMYKLFHRDKNVDDLCISSQLMNQYQQLIEELAYDVLETKLYDNLDLSWQYKSVFLTYQGSDFSVKTHRGIILYEKCVPKHQVF